ncbi:MAG: hypothetical protein M3081_01575 [Gemmatimonadota bacterium]|nr:hypothetical protein [Gemmatimonadota bacterium]
MTAPEYDQVAFARTRPRRAAALSTSSRAVGVHVVDLAVLYAELDRAPGISQADIARRYQKSQGYVSVLCRLGVALIPLFPDERDALRVPHFTFKAAQLIVTRARGDAGAIVRAAQSLAQSRPRPRKRRGARSRFGASGPAQWDQPLAGAGDDLDPVLGFPSPLADTSDEFAYRWDEELARRDPRAALAAYEAHVDAMTTVVIARLRRAAGATGESLTTAKARTFGDPALALAAAQDRLLRTDISLRELNDRVSATLRAHRAKLDAFLEQREHARRKAEEE